MSDLDIAIWWDAELDPTLFMLVSIDSCAAFARILQSPTDIFIQLPGTPVPQAPWVYAASGIQVELDAKPGVAVAKRGDVVVFSGHPDSLAVLGSTFERLAKGLGITPPIHIEYFPDNGLLREGTVPVVVRWLAQVREVPPA